MTEYEFTEQQNAVISALAVKVTVLGIINVIAAVVMWVYFAADTDYILLLNGTILLISALAFMTPMQDLTLVVRSEGSDISDLRTAFVKLNSRWIIFIAGYGYLRLYQYFQFV